MPATAESLKIVRLEVNNKPTHNERLFIELIQEGYLEIDSHGRIWRIAEKYGNQFVKYLFIPIKRRRAEYKTNSGHLMVDTKITGKTIHSLAHRLVWIFFNGEIPDDMQINHKNGIKTDNRPENLELLTVSENTQHAYNILGKKAARGEKQGSAKLTENEVIEIRNRYKTGETQESIAGDFHISRPQISNVVNRKQWAHVL